MKERISHGIFPAPIQEYPPFPAYPIPHPPSHLSNLFKNILEIVQRPERDALRPHDAIRRGEVEVKVRQRVLGDVPLPGEAKVARLCLHDDLFVLLAVDAGRVHGLEDLDGAVDAGLEVGKGRLGVFKDGDAGGAEAGDGEFGRVRAGLDLEWEPIKFVLDVLLSWMNSVVLACPRMSSIRR